MSIDAFIGAAMSSHSFSYNVHSLDSYIFGSTSTHSLASTHILTRISVVHHAALNCIRRLFAIVVTSIVFGVRITMVSGLGILISIVGFLSYTRFKVERQKQTRPLSSLLPISNVQ